MIKKNTSAPFKFFTLFLTLASSSFTLADDVTRLQTSIGVDYRYISFDGADEDDMGMAGINLNVSPENSNFYGGINLYGSVKGTYSGFFALGFEGGYRLPLSDQVELEIGAMLGAGGGHGISRFIKDGHIARFHTGVNYNLAGVKLGLAYENLRFLDTDIESNHLKLSAQVPVDLSIFSFDRQELFLPLSDKEKYFAFTTSSYHPEDGTLNRHGELDIDSTKFIGVEYGHQLTGPLYAVVNFKGSVYGHTHGYADLFVGLAYKPTLFQPNLKGVARIDLGTGGGASVDVGSGFLVHFRLGLEYRFSPKISAEVGLGVLTSPSNSYQAETVNAQFNYYLNSKHKTTPYRFSTRLGNQTYINPIKEKLGEVEEIHLGSLKIDSYLNESVYITGQMALAYTGDVAGYFSGLMGVGVNKKFSEDSSFGYVAEFLVGAAGGARLDLGEGFIVAPNIGLTYQLNKRYDLYVLAGKTISSQGAFNANTVEFGIKYNFSMYL